MVWLQVFLKAWNFFIELQDYKFYVQNYEFWSFGENPHIFKLTLLMSTPLFEWTT